MPSRPTRAVARAESVHARTRKVPARPLATLVGVAAALGALIATGPHAATAGTQVSASPVQAPTSAVAARSWSPAVRPGSMHRAIQSLPAAAIRRTASHPSRSHRRKPLHRWVRPNYGPITSPFGMRWGRMHEGVDLGGAYGSAIKAATDGCITYAGPMAGYGEVMMIHDWDGTKTVYGHMSAFVRRQGCVKAGQVIARVGEAGDATGPHLHFEVRIHGKPIDPVPFLRRKGVRL